MEVERLRAEVERLRSAASQESEAIQLGWLSPAEAAGLKAELERLREAYKSAEQTIRLGQKQVAAWKRGEKWCPRCEGTGATGAGVVCCAALAGEVK